jgi:hypothetical protein
VGFLEHMEQWIWVIGLLGIVPRDEVYKQDLKRGILGGES